MKKNGLLLLIAALNLTFASYGGYSSYEEVVDGVRWRYWASPDDETLTLGLYDPPTIRKSTTGEIAVPSVLGGRQVSKISAF